MLFVCALLTLSLIDIDHQVLPDLLVLPLLWTGLLFNSLSLFVDLHSGRIWCGCRVSCAVVVLPGASYPDGQGGYGPWRFQIVRRDWRLARCTDAADRACVGMYLLFVFLGVPQIFSWPGYAGPYMFRPLSVIGCACNDTWDNPLGGHLILPDPGQIFRL